MTAAATKPAEVLSFESRGTKATRTAYELALQAFHELAFEVTVGKRFAFVCSRLCVSRSRERERGFARLPPQGRDWLTKRRMAY